MPYYLHTADNPPNWHDGYIPQTLERLTRYSTLFACYDADHLRTFDDAKTANDCRLRLNKETPGAWSAVVFIPTIKEMKDWRVRESHRINGLLPPELDKDGEQIIYAMTPWQTEEWYCYHESDPSYYGLQYRHYVHMSRVMPGQVAFTPSEEYGVQNRKTRMTVARYLDKFSRYPDGSARLTAKDIARYVAIVKAHADQKLRLARSASEIVSVYLNGPGSCMSHGPEHYSATGGVHPVEAYANSDLAVAYCGDPKDGVSARSVVWPEKKIYTRIYGDTTLELILQKHGYKKDSLSGATIPARKVGSEWLMPYIDAADSAILTTVNRRQVFRLSDDAPYGERWQVKVTGGLAEPAEEDDPPNSCSNCEADIDGDGYEESGLCRSCYRDRWTCDHCDSVSFSDDDRYGTDDGEYCGDCYHSLYSRCVECGEDYRNPKRSADVADRHNRNVADLCPDCGDGKMRCTDCREIVTNDDDHETCDDCRPDEDDEETETAKPETDGE